MRHYAEALEIPTGRFDNEGVLPLIINSIMFCNDTGHNELPDVRVKKQISSTEYPLIKIHVCM